MAAPNKQQVCEYLQSGTYLDPNVHHTVLKNYHGLDLYDMQCESDRETIRSMYGRNVPDSCAYVARLLGLHKVRRIEASPSFEFSTVFVEFYPPGDPELAGASSQHLGEAVIYRFPSSGRDTEKEAQHCAAKLATVIDDEDNKTPDERPIVTPETVENDNPPQVTFVDWCHLL